MRRRFLAVIAVLAMTACTMTYKPVEYPLRSGLIPAVDVAGTVTITNGQPSTESVIVYSYAGTKMSSDLRTITHTMVQQATGEVTKNTRKTSSGKAKTIDLKVNSLRSEYVTFFWKSQIQFQAKLGNGEVIEKTVPHSSGDLNQDLNGCIAEGVMVLLKDDKVRAYLARAS